MKKIGIVAVSMNGVIGKEGKLPWHLSDDLKRFKATTTGHSVIMGRKAYMEIGKPLPNRVNYVLTHDTGFKADGCVVCTSLSSAFEHALNSGETICYVIGGATVYKEAMPFLDELFVTEVKAEVEGDVLMPPYKDRFRLDGVVGNHEADEKNDYAVEYQVWIPKQ